MKTKPKMKFRLKAFVLIFLIVGLIHVPIANASDRPIVESFTMTPDSLDTATANRTVSFDLIINNSTGISNTSTQLTLSDGGNNSIVTSLVRTDTPINLRLQKVTFHGSIIIPSNLPAGVYFASARPITGLNVDGTNGYSTDYLSATTDTELIGAKNALLIRNGGVLNFSFATFVGPSFKKYKAISFIDPKFNNIADPIWKVGESLNPSDYYELRVPNLILKSKSNTPLNCSSDGSQIKFLKEGSCEFVVYTDGNEDYQNLSDIETVNISSARVKPTYYVGSIATQDSSKLPLTIAGPLVYGPLGTVIPVSATPLVCFPSGSFISIISGGTCSLNYSTPGNANYLPSDVYTLTFQISRTTQTVTFAPQTTASTTVGSVVLAATASSGLPVIFTSQTPSICDLEGSSLKLKKAGTCQVTAAQVGSATIAPASVTQAITVTSPVVTKKIACIKNGKIKYFLSKKCPTGYKQKK